MSHFRRIKFIKWGIILGILVVLIIIYKVINPADYGYFPKCPFRVITGLYCPGCGSQRAIHHLLNLNVKSAFLVNPLLVLSIPYLIIGVWFDLIKNPTPRQLVWRKRFFGTKAIVIILFIIITFWVIRNVVLFIK